MVIIIWAISLYAMFKGNIEQAVVIAVIGMTVSVIRALLTDDDD